MQGCAGVKVVKSISYFVEETHVVEEIREMDEVVPFMEEHPDGEEVNVE
jgi:hypothetical protein